ncbi:MAG TPA: pirin family protein [Phycisphaerae bacterium]|nr:pirin family protein [Phycisphaerales bacterium]HRX83626.1 pirin family protein [Phycisphaerae bacterium]
MITVRRSQERGHFNHGWLDTYHTFSFADYRDARHMGFRTLRVINEDRVAPGAGFGEHPHRDMEILTYVLSGALQHRDSLGNGAVITPGEVQYMAAGTGILHSEFNPSPEEPVHLMQIWIRPDRRGAEPQYDQRRFPALADAGAWTLLASGDGRAGSIRINQDADVFAATLRAGEPLEHTLAAGRGAWIQVLRGAVTVDGEDLSAGDGAGVTDQSTFAVAARTEAEVLLFDLA